jgi:hypothetical protein
MSLPSALPLYDPAASPASWNERMAPGEYAVLDSTFDAGVTPFCAVFPSRAEAIAYAKERVAGKRSIRCRVYDHHGFGNAPLKEFRGAEHKGESELTQRFRRVTGSILFFGGMGLTLWDWCWHDWGLQWPAMIGTRMILPGLSLLIVEGWMMYYARQKDDEA